MKKFKPTTHNTKNNKRIRTTQQESLSQQVEENKSLTITIVLEWK